MLIFVTFGLLPTCYLPVSYLPILRVSHGISPGFYISSPEVEKSAAVLETTALFSVYLMELKRYTLELTSLSSFRHTHGDGYC
nr:MAG TPA: hypothetical protein [Caudoviricetes sp.]